MALEVFRGGLDWTAATKSVFRRQSDGWVAHGRFADHPAERIEGEVWNGLEAVVDCGISAGGGVHAAAGECLWAVLSDGRMSVVADTQGMSPVGDDIRRVIRSVRFTRS
ncbi:MAG TPA: hypothetical protein VMS37_21055 [Verrucomicrobiae bacterium]|nr:hypothetical protein [Verrucomicrobiae bacterium]